MSTYEGLTFSLYVERKSYPDTWFHDLFQALWEHGLEFTKLATAEDDSVPGVTWDEVLKKSAQVFFSGQRPASAELPLEKVIQAFGNGTSGSLDIRDKSLEEMYLHFDIFPLKREQEHTASNPYGIITLKVSGIYCWTDSAPQVSGMGALLLPYQQTWLAFLHWSKLLCRLVSPLYGVGYADDYELQKSIATEVALNVSSALGKDQLPDLRTILRSGGCRYIPSRYVDTHLLDSLLEQPELTIQRLVNRGLFVIPLYFPFQYEHNEVYRQRILGRKAHEQGAEAERITAYYRRAQGILERLHSERVSFPPPLQQLAEANHWEATMILENELARLLQSPETDG